MIREGFRSILKLSSAMATLILFFPRGIEPASFGRLLSCARLRHKVGRTWCKICRRHGGAAWLTEHQPLQQLQR